ncbi:unnamed protein product [Cochlearia groenlandica]
MQMASESAHPICQRAMDAQEEHTPSQSAALIAVSLISSARVILKLDSEFTEYSAHYLVENACPKKKDREGETDLTVKDAFKYIFKEGIPRADRWAHLGCVVKQPAFARYIPRVPMKGEVIETNNLVEAFKMHRRQPIGARLHVFSPALDRVGEEGIYVGLSDGSSYVGLRDCIMVAVKPINGDIVATVQLLYKKKTLFVKVSTSITFLPPNGEAGNEVREPSGLLVDFCAPLLSIS